MRRCAKLKRVDHAAKSFAHFAFIIAGDFKGFEHDFGFVVSDRARNQFIAVARQIILVAQNRKRITLKRLHTALRHRKRIMFKIDFTGFCIFFINWKINNPSEGKAIFIG